jgi:hypothetical protein
MAANHRIICGDYGAYSPQTSVLSPHEMRRKCWQHRIAGSDAGREGQRSQATNMQCVESLGETIDDKIKGAVFRGAPLVRPHAA